MMHCHLYANEAENRVEVLEKEANGCRITVLCLIKSDLWMLELSTIGKEEMIKNVYAV